jgi:regulator of sigma E protease
MSAFISAVIIILVLGVLITVHEIGHYVAARLCGIRVREFAIGMGPVFFRRQKKNGKGEAEGTKFSLRVFPIGGFCDMGEDEDSDDPAHFRNNSVLKRIFVLVSGSMMNFLLGFVFFFILYLSLPGLVTPVVRSTEPDFPYAEFIQPGDRFHSINGRRIHNITDFYLFLDRDVDKPYTFVMSRSGEKFTVDNAVRQLDGGRRFGFSVAGWEDMTFTGSLRHAATSTVSYVRLVWISLGDLISGNAGMEDMMGPVGMGSIVNDIISEEGSRPGDIIRMILQLSGLIAVNLAVVNLLPIPALDGGRIVFLFISAVLVMLRGKPLNSKLEGYIHGITMLLLFALMIFIFYNDILRVIGRLTGQ